MATEYGKTINSRWRAILVYSTSSTNTETTVTAKIRLQVNGYAVSYNGVTGTVTVDGTSKSATKSVNKGYGSDVTYYDYASVSKTFTRGHSASSKSVSGKMVFGAGSSSWQGTSSASAKVSIPAKPSYSVSYNANGGSGAPSKQTKWYGETLKLSSTKPTRTGYTFQGWAKSSDGSVAYAAGANYTSNAAVTLYAVWKANTWTISYDANGGSGAPDSQTKTYGQTLTLSSTVPTRTNYNFLGWATSSTATSAEYQPGGSFTTNATTTLYAVWQLAYVAPRITSLNADRCDSAGTLSEEGTYAKVTFDWTTDKTVNSVTVLCNDVTTTVSGQSETSGSVSVVVGAGALSTENSYSITVTVTDTMGSSSVVTKLPPLDYIIDFSPQGGVGIGWPASNNAQFDVYIPSYFHDSVDFDSITNSGNIINDGTITSNHIYLRNNQAIIGQLTSDSYTPMLCMNASNQVELNWTTGGLRGRVMKLLWSGTWSTGSIIVPEAPYYNYFWFAFTAHRYGVLGIRDLQYADDTQKIQMMGIVYASTMHYTLSGQAIIDGSKLTIEFRPSYVRHNPGSDHNEEVKLSISQIYGLL